MAEKQKHNPSAKARKFVKLFADNLKADKPRSIKAIAQQAGYDKAGYGSKPDRLIKTKSVQQLFAQAGISGNRLAEEYNKLLNLPVEEETITISNKIRMLKDLSNVVLLNPNDQKTPQLTFIERFLNLDINQKPSPETLKNIPKQTIEEAEISLNNIEQEIKGNKE